MYINTYIYIYIYIYIYMCRKTVFNLVCCQVTGGGFHFDLAFPTPVDTERASAKFSTRSNQLRVTVAEA